MIYDSEFDQLNFFSNDKFLKDLNINSYSLDAVPALAIRRAIAAIAEVKEEQISACHSFALDLSMLGSWDSLDTVEFFMELEEKLGFKIPHSVAEKLPGLLDQERIDPNYRVGDMTLSMIKYLKHHQLLRSF